MKHVMRAMLAGLLAIAMSGCLNWQAGYNHAARSECLKDPDDRDRQACLERVDRNARDRAWEERQSR